MAVLRPIHVLLAGKQEYASLSLEGTALKVKNPKAPAFDIPLQCVVASSFREDHHHLEIAYVSRKKTNSPYAFIKLQGEVKDGDREIAEEWCRAVTEKAYEGTSISDYSLRVRQNRRLKVLVNPKSGTGKAVKTFVTTVEPILRTAGCSLDVVHTKHSGHGREIASEIPLDTYDAVLIVSGDGLIHEVMNGFALHSKPRKAFAIAIAPIPAGSGNALSLNLLGLKDGFDCVAAAMNVLKGKLMNVDVCSFTQNEKRTISFMTQSVGMLADMDIGTDHLRWMGDARFTWGFLRELAKMKPCAVELSYKVETVDKKKMVEDLRERRDHPDKTRPPPISSEAESDDLPLLRYPATDTAGWTVHKEPMMYVYAGKGPYVARDYMTFPVSLPDDGLIDIVARGVSARKELLTSSLDGWANGQAYWNENVQYIRAHAYRIKPLATKTKSTLALDGEEFPLVEFQVEVIPRLATLLSPQDHYAIDFKI
ncbi:sphinganine kinase lcb4 [Marasmius crinis-equi]|uniref:Sphinganine kinase lcb4 n=1 Tax=Marasmius crinis-equi TaxID=585013 RepID=A0ABR3FR21_9AGAR